MKLHALAALIGLALFAALPAEAQPEPLSVYVDCDAGDDLGQALREIEGLVGGAGSADDEDYDYPVEGPRLIEVNISGTCVANVTLTLDHMTLRGVGEEPAVIRGDPDWHGAPVIEARYAQHVLLQNLNVTDGWIGVRLAHSLAVIHECDLSGNGTGLQSENSRSIVVGTRFERNRDAIFTFGGDHLLLDDFLIADNTQDGILGVGSHVTVGPGEIRDTRIGIRLQGNATGLLRADLIVRSSVSVLDSSHLAMYGPATIADGGRLFVGNQSLFEAYDTSIQGNVVLARWGRAFFTDTPIEGEVTLYDFSETRFDGAGSERVYCDATSDAVCETGSVDAVLGCKHCDGPAPGNAGSDAGFTPPDGPAIRELLENLLSPVEDRIGGGPPGGKTEAPTRPRGIQGR